MGVFGSKNRVFTVFCIFLHFLSLFWQNIIKTLQELGVFFGFLTRGQYRPVF